MNKNCCEDRSIVDSTIETRGGSFQLFTVYPKLGVKRPAQWQRGLCNQGPLVLQKPLGLFGFGFSRMTLCSLISRSAGVGWVWVQLNDCSLVARLGFGSVECSFVL